MRSIDHLGQAAVWLGLLLWASAPVAQTVAAPGVVTKQLSPDEVKSRYQSCPRGYYSGPQPGKARYTKDPWVWAVTPAFAAAFCMPPEFISLELRGAEAVAYKMVQNNDEIVCGWGENAEVCSPGSEHRFEVYYKSGTIPKERDAPYHHYAHAPSAMLLTKSEKEYDELSQRLKGKPRIGARSVFATGAFGLMSVRGDKFAWPLGSLGALIYFQDAFVDLDYVAFEGGSGFSRNQNWIKHGSRELVITVRKVPDPAAGKRTDQLSFDQLALLIKLPASISEQVIRNDQAKGIDLQGMARRAFGASVPGR